MPKKESEIRKKINEMAEENEYYNLQQNKNRARSITCGTAFGGTIEVNMRGDHHSMWCSMTPVEALEFAEQMAAACGVQVALRPKDDFSAWRGWDLENTEYSHFKGAAPWQVANIAGANIHQSRLGGSGGTQTNTTNWHGNVTPPADEAVVTSVDNLQPTIILNYIIKT